MERMFKEHRKLFLVTILFVTFHIRNEKKKSFP